MYSNELRADKPHARSKENYFMPSFDVVSRTDLMELDNSINGVLREIKQRFDLAGTKCDVSRTDTTLTVVGDDEMRVKQVEILLHKHLAKRKIDQDAIKPGNTERAAESTTRKIFTIVQGVDPDLGRKISKAIRGTKSKVQVSLQGDELRVSSKKKDDLQETIEFIKGMKVGQPLQYVNFRE
jgi:uncharacterized protein YajQ (UPF0234 family)